MAVMASALISKYMGPGFGNTERGSFEPSAGSSNALRTMLSIGGRVRVDLRKECTEVGEASGSQGCVYIATTSARVRFVRSSLSLSEELVHPI